MPIPPSPVPAGLHTLTPHLVCAGAADAIAFYREAFGALEFERLAAPDGRIVHAGLRIGDSTIFLADEMPERGQLGPKAIGGTAVRLALYLEDADAAYARAVAAGATPRLPMADVFWGDRYGQVEDPYGHHWSLATRVREVGFEAMAEMLRSSSAS